MVRNITLTPAFSLFFPALSLPLREPLDLGSHRGNLLLQLQHSLQYFFQFCAMENRLWRCNANGDGTDAATPAYTAVPTDASAAAHTTAATDTAVPTNANAVVDANGNRANARIVIVCTFQQGPPVLTKYLDQHQGRLVEIDYTPELLLDLFDRAQVGHPVRHVPMLPSMNSFAKFLLS